MAKIIVVDDHKTILSGMTLLLKDLGHEVLAQATNGKEFLDLLGTYLPDVVLMDVQMPVMDGIEATRRAIEQYPELKVLILTMYDDEDYYNSLIECGAKGFILKESEHEEVERAIGAICEGRLYFSQELLIKLLKKRNTTKQIDLKPREKEILSCLCKGLSSAEIANIVNLSSRTIEKNPFRTDAKNRHLQFDKPGRIRHKKPFGRCVVGLSRNPDRFLLASQPHQG
ncbi:MAG: response regulator transcription factor [Breznakibacter sp.]